MNKFSKQRINPLEFINNYYSSAYTNHITYNPNMKSDERDIWMVRQASSDGTLIFTIELLASIVEPLLKMQTFCKTTEPEDWSEVSHIEYTIGDIRLSTVYGQVQLGIGEYPGQKERARMPVAVRYVMKEQVKINAK